ncbi:unnamed protein product [Laminaria digitata]
MRFVRYALGPFHRSRRCLQGQVGAVAGARPHSTQRAFGTPGDRISCSRNLNLSTSTGQRGLPEAGPLAAYARLVGEGKIREDEHQLAALHILQELHASLAGYQPQVRVREQHLGLWASVLNRMGGNAREPEPIAEAPVGVYMHGGVGTGKTFMMDLFFQVGGGMPR